ncbi:MAG: translation initiation factor IF-2 [Phycisphaerales bacterium]
MTTKISKIRVSELAKELGVSFKQIQARCETEGVDTPKTASSTISRGLAETVRQWFQDVATERAATGGAEASEASTATATDEAPAKKPVRRSTKSKTAGEADATTHAAPAVDSAAAPAAPVAAPAAPVAAPAAPVAAAPAAPAPAPAPVAAAAPAAPAPAAPAPSAPVRDDIAPRLPGEGVEVVTSPDSAVMHPAVDAPVTPAVIGKAHRAPARPAEAAPAAGAVSGGPGGSSRQTITRPPAGHTIAPASKPPVMNVPRRPDVVKPVGTMLDQPVKTALSGPKVIRVEQPDNLPAPRRMPPGGTGMRGPGNRVGTGGAGGPGVRTDRPGRSNSSPNRSGRAGEGRGRDTSGGFTRQDLSERDERLQHAGGFFKQRRRQQAQRDGHAAARAQPSGPQDLAVRVTEPISIKELSEASGVKAADILKKLMLAGQITTINGTIETERAIEIMMEYGIDLQVTQAQSAAEIIESQFEKRERQDERSRPPVVTILGHVDHGKTSLLDRIRNTNVAAGEAGGITQATSAFQVPVKAGEKERVVTFIDTPGHEAFTQMRARGARVTDIAVLVVAADDGVMPQTVESIAHAKAAGVPIVVALNKIDKPEATQSNIQRILGQLAEQGLNPVEWGGDTEVIRVSATKGTGIQELLDMLDYQADLRDLKADAKGLAQGSCLEAQMEEGRGTVARILVQEGQLKKGDFIVCGRAFGRVRDIVGDRGGRVEAAGPSTPVAISGLDELPDAGDKFYCVKSLKEAENAAVERRRIERERELAAPKITLDNIFEHMGKAGIKELPLVVKADVQGSVETLRSVLSKIKSEEVAVSVKHCAVGGINESDVALAEATKAIVVGFNVTSNAKARALAEAKGIEMRLYDVIYDLTDDVAKAASGLLEPELKLEVLGHAEVREVYKISKVGAVAGCYVTDGTVERNAQIRVTRGGIVVEKDRRLEQLKRFKDDAKEVRAGNECGMKIDGYDDIKVGDVLECYKTIKVARGLAAAARKE